MTKINKKTKKICPVCGREWFFALKTGDGWCLHDENALGLVGEEAYKQKIEKEITDWRLSRSYYLKNWRKSQKRKFI